MQKLTTSKLCVALLMVALTVMSACASQQQKNRRKPAKKMAKVEKKMAAPTMGNMSVLHVPTGEMATSAVTLTNSSPYEVNLGQPYDYEITATNLTAGDLEGVTVTDVLPMGMEFISADPAVTSADGQRLIWALGTLAPGEKRTIRVRAKATQTGDITHCADVTYNQSACVKTAVVEPALKLTKTMTPNVLTCDPITVVMTVENNGTGVAKNVVVRANLPAGLTMADGSTQMEAMIGDLPGGSQREIRAQLMASKTGEYTCDAVATADNGLRSEASASTVATKPELTISKTGPDRTYAGKTVSYEIMVKNIGNGDARDTIVSDALPAGTSYVSSTPAGSVNGGTVNWNLGTLAAGDERTVTVVVRANTISTITNNVRASAYCADAVSASHTTEVNGIPGILMEVVDVEDPIAVGDSVVYVIRVYNQGSAADTNINIVCELEAAGAFVSASGATAGTHSDGTITFAPLSSLAAGAEATWRVTVKAVDAADFRFKVSRTTDNTTRPVEETESTNFYK